MDMIYFSLIPNTSPKYQKLVTSSYTIAYKICSSPPWLHRYSNVFVHTTFWTYLKRNRNIFFKIKFIKWRVCIKQHQQNIFHISWYADTGWGVAVCPLSFCKKTVDFVVSFFSIIIQILSLKKFSFFIIRLLNCLALSLICHTYFVPNLMYVTVFDVYSAAMLNKTLCSSYLILFINKSYWQKLCHNN